MLARKQCTWNFSYTADETQNGSVTWENSLAHEIQHTYIYNAAIIPSHLAKRNKHACSYKTFKQMFIALLFIITKNWRDNKTNAFQPAHIIPKRDTSLRRYYSAMKGNNNTHDDMDGSQTHYVKWKKPDSEGYIRHQKYISGSPGLGRLEGDRKGPLAGVGIWEEGKCSKIGRDGDCTTLQMY